MNTGKLLFLLLIIFLIRTGTLHSKTGADDLDKVKMEKVTSEILDIFKSQIDDRASKLRPYISTDWTGQNHINLKKYQIDNFNPDHYTILTAYADICIAQIGGADWEHLIIFRFTEEDGKYRVIPQGLSEASKDYIEPWSYVKLFICDKKDK